MPIPDLTLTPGGCLSSSGVGVPVNGVNTFKIGILTQAFQNDDSMKIDVEPLGSSIRSWSYVPGSLNLDVDPPEISMNFEQSGNDACRVTVLQKHSLAR